MPTHIEFFLCLKFKTDTPPAIIKTLKYLAGRLDSCQSFINEIKEPAIFDVIHICSGIKWELMGADLLTIYCYSKDNAKKVEEFIKYIIPFVDAKPREYLGYKRSGTVGKAKSIYKNVNRKGKS